VETETIEVIVMHYCWEEAADVYTLHIDSAEYECGDDDDDCLPPDFSVTLRADDQPAWVEIGAYSESETLTISGVMTPASD
jgi:hypothetical protein